MAHEIDEERSPRKRELDIENGRPVDAEGDEDDEDTEE